MDAKKQKQEIISRLDKDFVEAADRMFEDAKNNKGLDKLDEKSYRKVDKEEAAKIKEKTGLDVEGFEHQITNTDFRHIYLDHGDPKKEIPMGQIAITNDDLKLIPEITKNYDDVELSKNTSKSDERKILIYKKKIDHEYYYLETVGGKKNRVLRPKTLYIKNGRRKAVDVH
ncbi:MAG: hypothetical protein LBJ25_07360 [Candidatus Margulisbacteria bacterium]|jgi:hypothetical protein|nr:hypothetical protein [Candidatus Margulisiibacteriota bacterium]